jgi:hypothetical protein
MRPRYADAVTVGTSVRTHIHTASHTCKSTPSASTLQSRVASLIIAWVEQGCVRSRAATWALAALALGWLSSFSCAASSGDRSDSSAPADASGGTGGSRTDTRDADPAQDHPAGADGNTVDRPEVSSPADARDTGPPLADGPNVADGPDASSAPDALPTPDAGAPDGPGGCAAVACDWGMLGRADGTMWSFHSVRINYPDGSPFVARSFSAVTFAQPQACAVRADGAVFCLGFNGAGQLGTGDFAQPDTQIPQLVVTGVGGPPLQGIVAVSASYAGACAIDAAGAAWCWGDGQYAQLGNGTMVKSAFAVPVLVGAGGAQLSGVRQIAAGIQHVCALKADGTVWCWGYGGGVSGVVGSGGTNLYALYPTQVAGLPEMATSISTGDAQTCVSTVGGSVWCWGGNVLGNGVPNSSSATPIQVLTAAATPLTNAARVVVGSPDRACSHQRDGTMWCWGTGSPFAQNFTAGLFALPPSYQTAGATFVGRQCFIDLDHAFFYGQSVQTQPDCP